MKGHAISYLLGLETESGVVKELNLTNTMAAGYLQSAVKSDPRNIDAWNSLGEVFARMGDFRQAKGAFEMALGVSRNPTSLRLLSMVMRKLVPTPYNPGNTEMVEMARKCHEKGLALARESVELDPTDGESWYVLGNALLQYSFVVTHSDSDLHQALGSYTAASKAEKKPESLVDLHYNRATVLRYLGRYPETLEALRESCRLDPGWDVPAAAVKDLERLLNRVAESLAPGKGRDGPARAKKATATTPPLGCKIEGRTLVAIKELSQDGSMNTDKGVALRVSSVVTDPSTPAGFVALCEEGGTGVGAWYVHDLDLSQLVPGTLVTLLDPTVRALDDKGTLVLGVKGPSVDRALINGARPR